MQRIRSRCRVGNIRLGLMMMKTNSLTVLCFALLSCVATHAHARISHLRCEYLTHPMAIDVAAPRFSWQASIDQEAYQLQVASSVKRLEDGKCDVWQSERRSGKANSIVYEGEPLRAHSTCYWRVCVWDDKGKKTLSPIAQFETAKMNPSDWNAKWITDGHTKQFKASPLFRKTFDVSNQVKKARLFVSGVGYCEMFIRGEKVGENLLDPGYTDFSKRVLYVTHDVTNMLRKGSNVMSAVLGNGWFNMQSIAVWNFDMAHWRKRPQMIAELHIEYTDGAKQVILTDESWRTSTGPYLFNSLYTGDTYDARLEQAGWKTDQFDDTGWKKVKLVQSPAPLLVSQSMPAIQCSREFKPVHMKKFSPTLYVFDMGINMAGICRLKVTGKTGTKITLKHGEKVHASGRVDLSNLTIHFRPNRDRRPVPDVDPNDKFQTDTYILKGDGVETYTPTFTYHGFQYVEVESSEAIVLNKESLTALFVHTNVQQTGSFRCSNDLLNKLWDATHQSYLSNLHSIPTDCPQREKNGWTADAWVAMDFGLQTFDAITVYEKWVNDMVDNVTERGYINSIIPSAGWDMGLGCGPVWAGAVFFVPEKLHQYYGDTTAIRRLYPVCERYLKFLQTQEKNGILDHGLGDWVFYKTKTPNTFTSTAFYYEENRLMAQFARRLGRDATPYEAKADELLHTLNERFFHPGSLTYANGSQAAMATALYFNIVPKDLESKVAAKLHDMIRANNDTLDFGLLGSKFMLPVLTKYGYAETAYKMVTQEEIPSWGAFIKMGYTTLPEAWTVNDASKDASLNHVFLGDVSDWMTKAIAGIKFDDGQRGYDHIVIQPHFISDLTWAKAEYRSNKGLIKSEWKRNGNMIELTVTIPANTTATVFANKVQMIGSGVHTFAIEVL